MTGATEQAVKPPTQGIGAQGIEPKPIELTPSQELRVNWQMVGTLPPFQMFVNEQAPCPEDRNQQQWAIDYGVRYGAQLGDQVLIERYAQWHQAKGYWPRETIFGELLPEQGQPA
ncbi:hypothetical protein [Pseudomonas aeruginosa]|uniref:hypothetical protein n=1 Tax=Pseudomonas aeruginosa TaxID=287 RepID=UPI00163B6523|nr:hypothetical protein [Pseudomonas aeruginosa]WOT60877.1 hypothetical protein R5018_25120 [Pseudomonas aeruginosa]WOT74315.1 hypothetical protein R5026_27835 [Pseudomonas aeruginosa]WOT85436.1 hypothetical protein R5020_18795 [Pseudomonas aeruginosa]WOT98390.1 hypothetical protein R5015_18725 [Pseudomonas aeruginosa]WOU41992.1 hypothetical protein R5029_15870 [Pseudomonas aeruginosa]